MTAAAPGRAQIDRLRSAVTGQVYEAGDPALAAETLGANLTFAHTPAVAVAAETVDDVAAAVRFAAEAGLPVVAVQGTGHGSTCPIEDAVLINTSRLTGVDVDPAARRARVQPGARWAHVHESAEPHGLAGLVGSYTGVGVLGYTLGGGQSPILGRRHGFAADLVRSVDLVTADGELRHVDADTDPDLFWAVRGGKGSFGVATALEFDLVPVRRFYGGGMFLPWSAAPEVLHTFATWSLELPEEASSSVALLRFPPVPDVPEPLRGQSVVQVCFSHLGDADEAERLFAPMRAIATPIMDNVGELPISASDAVHMDPTDPMPFWYGAASVRELPPAGVDALLDAAWANDSPLIMVELHRLGGALSRQPEVPNAVAGRDGQFFVFPLGLMLPELAEIVPGVAETVLRAVDPWATEGTLLNFSGCGLTAEKVRAFFPTAYQDRLLAVKRAVDPADMFRYGSGIGIG
jgi:hypothetical protein